MQNPIIIFGTGALGLQAYDIFRRNGVIVYGFLDDNKALHGTEIGDVSVLGDTDDGGYLKLIGHKCDAFVAIGEKSIRGRLTEMLIDRRKTMPVNAIHDSALISETAGIGHGNLIGARVVLGPSTSIGHHCVIETGASLEPIVSLGDFVTVGPGAVINSRVTVGDNVFIGPGAVIVSGVSIGKNARIGAGSVIIDNVPEGATYFGNPARPV